MPSLKPGKRKRSQLKRYLSVISASNSFYGGKSHLFQLKFANHKLITTFATHGGLAHLARALAWQARGDRFESGILHSF